MTDEKNEKTLPVAKCREGNVSIAIFDGKYGLSVNVQKSYKKKEDKDWTNENLRLFPKEARALLVCLNDPEIKTMLEKEDKPKE